MPKNPKPKNRKLHVVAHTKRETKIVSTGPVTTSVGPSLERLRVGVLEEGMTELGRVTDAVVTRVTGSDPVDHILDLSKAYYREESAQGQHSVQCDRCMLKSPGAISVQSAIKIAEATGWVVTQRYDHCPVCKDGSKLLKGGSVALAPQVPLTHSDLILIARLRFVGGMIERGASVEAFLQNSVRSQHRSMLSDLAQETNYSTVPLIERVAALISRNADLPEVFSSDPQKAWAFFLDLYAALKTEDGAT